MATPRSDDVLCGVYWNFVLDVDVWMLSCLIIIDTKTELISLWRICVVDFGMLMGWLELSKMNLSEKFVFETRCYVSE